ncbi:MAG: hypothetical protein QW369_02395 [Desulfurococcaceae archaeon]
MDGRTLKIIIKGSRNYLRWTIEQWFYEVKDIVENEYGVKLLIEVIDGDEEYPLIMYGDKVFFEGLPGEEGYLIEVLKRIVEEALKLIYE